MLVGSAMVMPSVGPWVREIRVRDASGAFRTIFLATRPDAVYALHFIRKSSQKIAQREGRHSLPAVQCLALLRSGVA